MEGLDDIRQFIRGGDLKSGLEKLLAWTEQHATDLYPDAERQLTQLNELEKASMRFQITFDQLQVKRAVIRDATLQLLNKAKDQAGANKGAAPALQTHHAFTCDRSEQVGAFYQDQRQKAAEKIQFYYIYGLDWHEHKSLFQRLAYDKEGRLADFIAADNQPAPVRRCLPVPVPLDRYPDPDSYKIGLLKHLFPALGVPADTREPLLSCRLAQVLQNNSLLQDFGPEDYVCIYLSISAYHWDAKLIPLVVRWLINEFCACELPPHSPRFLFFFGLEYEEGDEQARQEVREAVRQSEHITALPELDMVTYRDVGAWFEKYDVIEPNRMRRRQLLEKHFGADRQRLFYMCDVQEKLVDIIEGRR